MLNVTVYYPEIRSKIKGSPAIIIPVAIYAKLLKDINKKSWNLPLVGVRKIKMDTKMYIFILDYANRIEEKSFIKDILKNFDEDVLVGCGIFVNNNPYNLEMLLFASLAKDVEKFDNYIKERYSKKKRIFNFFLDDMLSSISSKGYNVATFIDEKDVDSAISEDVNGIFLYPCKEKLNALWRSNILQFKMPRIFLSHSSKDKKYIDFIFDELQKSEIDAWYDKYQIEPGDSITDRINEGLDACDIGVICLSNNFLNGSSGWTKAELNYFIQQRMRDHNKKFIILNFDVPYDKMPPLVQDYRYIDFQEEGSVNYLINILKKKMNTLKA